MKNKETYEIDLHCNNCEEEISYEIPIGMLVEDFCKNLKCANCGCITMSKSNESQEEE